MPDETLPNFVLITEPDDLARLADVLRQQSLIAVDTESNSLFAYRERVCLVQFSIKVGDGITDYLVDPLALEDLAPLGPVFADPQIEKVFHAAEYDLLCLSRDYGFECNNLFDTMQAARILSRNELGLGALLEAYFGVVLDKRYQRADWGERPLTPSQLDYARLDTHYLIDLRDQLYGELAERNLVTLAEEDFRHTTLVKGGEPGRSAAERPVEWWRVSGASDLTPPQAAVLQELVVYRDQVARQMDRPLFKVIQDHILVQLAYRQPSTMREIGRIPGMTPHQVRRHGKALLSAIQRGLLAEPVYPPRPVRPDEGYLARLDALRTWRKRLGQEVGVASDVILPKDLMSELATGDPKNLDDLAQVMADFPWRLTHFGQDILNALNHS